MRSPLSEYLPGPTAMTRPLDGFSLAVSGRTIPVEVTISCSMILTMTLSSSGTSFMHNPPVYRVFDFYFSCACNRRLQPVSQNWHSSHKSAKWSISYAPRRVLSIGWGECQVQPHGRGSTRVGPRPKLAGQAPEIAPMVDQGWESGSVDQRPNGSDALGSTSR